MAKSWLTLRLEGGKATAKVVVSADYQSMLDGKPATVTESNDVTVPQELIAALQKLLDDNCKGCEAKLARSRVRVQNSELDRSEGKSKKLAGGLSAAGELSGKV